jgi:hypothetical protein
MIAMMKAHSLKASELEHALGFSPPGVQSALALPYPGLDFTRYKLFPPGRGTDHHSIRYAQPSGSGVHLYVLPSVRVMLNNAKRSLYWVEGEKKAAKGTQESFPCIGLGGLWNWTQSGTGNGIAELDTIVHVERQEIIVPDSDVWTRPDLLQAVYALGKELESRGARVSVVTIPPGADGAKVGLDDYLVVKGAAAFRKLLRIPLKHGSFTGQRGWWKTWKGSHSGRGTQSERVVDLVTDDVELFRSMDDELWATYPVNEHYETSKIRRSFRRWLSRRYYEHYKKAPSAQAMEDALRLLEARADAGAKHTVYTRIAKHDGAIYIDLCNDDWEAVEVTPDFWRVTNTVPVKFRRHSNAASLPHPATGGSLNELRPFVNVANEDDWRLLVGWLVTAARQEQSYLILILVGEQGSAKSTVAKVLRSLIDPVVTAASRALPRDERDLAITTRNAHVLIFSNISFLSWVLSDALCRIATGEGFATRQLYTDDDEAIFGGARPIILNGIENFAERGDLLDRAVQLHLPPIPETDRRDEETFWSDFQAAHPRILGALLDAVSAGLRHLPTTKPEHLPRMADCVRWVLACEPSLPWERGAFLVSYEKHQEAAVEIGLDASPVAKVLRAWLDAEKIPEYRGTASELLDLLNLRLSFDQREAKTWPKSPRALSGRLRRDAPALRAVGIDIQFDREGKDGVRMLCIRVIKADANAAADAKLPGLSPRGVWVDARGKRRQAVETVSKFASAPSANARKGRRRPAGTSATTRQPKF